MTGRGSVEGRERLRLFCALRLPGPVRDELVAWQHDAFARVPDDVRIVPRENLHVTLAFLGSTPADRLDDVVGALREAAARVARPVLRLRRYRETRSVGMLVFDDESGTAEALAVDLHGRLEALGVYEPEKRRWLPHLTVIRFRRPPRLEPPLPEPAPVSPSDAAVYHSVLRSAGAQYEVVESVALGG